MSDTSKKDNSISKKAFKAGAWYTVSNFLLKGIGFVTTPIFTRLLSKSEFGEYSNFTAWLSIIAILVTLEMSGCVYRARYDYEKDFDSFLSSIIACGSAITAVCYGVVLLFLPYFEKIFDMDAPYIHIMFLSVLISPALTIMQAKHRILQKYKSFVAVSVFSTLASTLVSLYCVSTFKDRLFGRIFGMSLPLLVVYLISYILMMSKGRKLYNAEYWKYAIVFSLPLVPHLLSNTLLGSSDRIMIKQICGAPDAALYSLAYSCGMIIAVLFTSINQAWEPWLFDRIHENDYASIKNISRYYLVLFMVIVLGSILVAPEFVLVMGGKGYYEAVYVVPPVMLGYGCKFIYTFYVNVERFEKKTKYISIGTIAAAVVNIILNLIFIPIFGYIAAAYTTLAGFFILVFMHYIICRMLGYSGMYDNRFIFVMMGVMILAGILAQGLYIVPAFVRWIVILLAGGICLLFAYRLYKVIRAKRS